MFKLFLTFTILLMVQVAHVQPVQSAMRFEQSGINGVNHCADDNLQSVNEYDHCSEVHFSCSMSGSPQLNGRYIPDACSPTSHPMGCPKNIVFLIERPPKF